MMARDEWGDEVFPDEDFTPVSPTPQPSEPKPPNQARTIVLAVVATIAVLVCGWFGWQAYSDHQDTKKAEQMASEVQYSMQDYFNTDSNLSKYTVRVLRVDLNKVSDTKYEGVATVNTAQSATEHIVPIDVVTYADKRFMWKAEPGALMFLAQQELQDVFGG